MQLTGGDRIAIKAKSKETRHYRPLGFEEWRCTRTAGDPFWDAR